MRFAPSPTGYLHIGGARTALFNWLFARRHGGQFILRIEDTDQKRSVDDSLDDIKHGLRWLGLQWDEGPEVGGDFGPYVQSERLPMYREWAEWLVEQGKAYRDYSTPEELEQARQAAEAGKSGTHSSRLHRYLSDEERAKLHEERAGRHVIRLAMPLDGEMVVQDAIRGEIRFPNAELTDIILLKSDGFPTYHLAMAVDDHFMEISHVMRGDEWLSSLATHQFLYDCLGWEAPVFAHLPVILKPDGKGKMSKRDKGATVQEYIDEGYQPEAVVNWLTNIGWSFGDDRDIFSVEESIARFSLDRINPTASRLPLSKLTDINGHYIREMPLDKLSEAVRPLLEAEYGAIDDDKLAAILPHVQVRINPLKQIVPLTRFLFAEDFDAPSAEQLIPKKMDASAIITTLERSRDTLANLPDFSPETQEAAMRALAEELEFKVGQLLNPLRWAVTNQQVSPPLFESMAALGREVSLGRIEAAIDILKG